MWSNKQRRIPRVTLGLALGLVTAVLVWQRTRIPASRDAPVVTERIRIEEVITNLSSTFTPAMVTQEPRNGAVHVGQLHPTGQLHSGHRSAIVAPAPSRLRFETPVPSGAVLRFGVAVEREGRRDAAAAGIRFRVDVDGREAFSRVVHPGATRHDRRWHDARVALAGDTERDAVIEFITEEVDGDASPAEVPGWSELRIVRESFRERQAAGPAIPNVLVLLADTLRADALGAYGASPTPSPTLDALAREGMVFDEAISQSSWTMPSVASLFTGLVPGSHGVVGGSHRADGGASAYLPDTLLTLAEYALAGGVTTVGVTGNSLVSRETNLARGFETFVDLGAAPDQDGWPTARQINDTFARWLGANGDRRFLAYLHYMDMHDPYRPPESLRPPSPAGVRPRVRRGEAATVYRKITSGAVAPLSTEELEHLRALYRAQVAYWDRELRHLLGLLDEAGVGETTILIVLSDHGEEFLEHGHLGHSKTLYDELLRVPLVIVGPGVPAARVDAQVQVIDLFPTVTRLLGLPPPPDLPGRDLLSMPDPRPALSETVRGVGPDGGTTRIVSLRTGGWKLVHMPALGIFQLYDLGADPAERHDRFGLVPESERLVGALAESERDQRPPPDTPGRDPRFHDKLRALGYID